MASSVQRGHETQTSCNRLCSRTRTNDDVRYMTYVTRSFCWHAGRCVSRSPKRKKPPSMIFMRSRPLALCCHKKQSLRRSPNRHVTALLNMRLAIAHFKHFFGWLNRRGSSGNTNRIRSVANAFCELDQIWCSAKARVRRSGGFARPIIGGFAAPGWLGFQRIFRPVMFWVLAAHVLAHILPGVLPKALQILGDGQRPTRR